jgi:hypothetical protein
MRLRVLSSVLVTLVSLGCGEKQTPGSSAPTDARIPQDAERHADARGDRSDALTPPPAADAEVPPPVADAEVPPPVADAEVPPPVADAEVPPPVADAEVPPPCVPTCAGRTCGDDGCGGTCWDPVAACAMPGAGPDCAAPCDDANPCTADACEGGACVSSWRPEAMALGLECTCAEDGDRDPLQDVDSCNG